MIIKFIKNTPYEKIQDFKNRLKNMSIDFYQSEGFKDVLILNGKNLKLNIKDFENLDFIKEVLELKTPYKLSSREFQKEDTVVDLGDNVKIGGNNFQIIAGPCSVESEKQLFSICKDLEKANVRILRGGAFKPRTSPYSFSGLGKEGLNLLIKAKKYFGFKIVTELLDLKSIEYFQDIDMIQVGARNMQNYDLLKLLGKVNKPVLLKRGISATYEELLLSSEYILLGGNKNVVLCERGIRTFERSVRNTMDVMAVPYLKEKTHLPLIVDPSHSAGVKKYVEPLSLAAASVNADGLIIEVHNNPKEAFSDGQQSVTGEEFINIKEKVLKIRKVLGYEK